jgi:hypothetical protein
MVDGSQFRVHVDRLVGRPPPLRIKLHTNDPRPMPQHKAQEPAGGSEAFHQNANQPSDE